MKYRPEIDGLRTVAVVPVVLYHAGYEAFAGGFVGVDVFFVISGFLITSIIMTDIENNRFSIISFYQRRLRRLLPALSIILLSSWVCAYFILLPAQFREFGQAFLATAVFLANIFFWLRIDYFDVEAASNPLIHMWSLGVEEQFYLFFPLILILFANSRQACFKIIIILMLVSFVYSVQSSFSDPASSFYLLPSRAWELLLGSALAFSGMKIEKRRAAEILSFFGLVLILLSMAFLDTDFPFPGVLALPSVLGSVLIIRYAVAGTLTHRILASRLFVVIGLISYSLYLWHQPILAFGRIYLGDNISQVAIVGLIALSFILASLTFMFIEKPIRLGHVWLFRDIKAVFITSSVIILLLSSLGFFTHSTRGFPERYSEYRISNYEIDNTLLQRESVHYINNLIASSGLTLRDFYATYDWFGDTELLKVLIVGNSFGKDVWNILEYSGELSSKAVFGRFDTQVAFAERAGLFDAVSYLETDVVLFATRWSDRRCWKLDCRSDFEVLSNLVEHAKGDGKQVIIVGMAPEFPSIGRQTYSDELILRQDAATIKGRERTELVVEINQRHWAAIEKAQAIYANNERLMKIADGGEALFLNRLELGCSSGERVCWSISEDLEKFYFDFGHITLPGAIFLAGRLKESGWSELITGLRED